MSGTSEPIGAGRTVIVGAVRYAELCGRGRQLLVDNGFTLVENETTVPWAADELQALIGAADAAVAGVEVFDADALARTESLRIISRLGVGLDNVDLPFARKRGVDVVNVPGGNAAAVAELVIGFVQSLLRRLPQMDDAARTGRWDRYVGRELAGKTVGLIGFGAIARVLTKRLSGFDVTVKAHDPYADPTVAVELGVELVSLEEAVADADVVSVHVPHLPSTHHLVDDALIARMRRGVILVNTSRGGLVDEAALVRGLDSGHVGGAALDVFEVEPVDPANPLFGRENVVTAPHAGADTLEAYDRIGLATAQAIVDVFSGRRPVNIAN
ncbi:phosphoglycerate dehydrogenase [Microbacterium capsulatum]|uniref:Phosphoglycerate dehydrogenase n=1 Tax=Microbacterium capsulatum TaxID=3041921 RepID=A0ABU0XFX5_9MICO|nr:phosphoglycerate dehydrogenase [Microbacterium sp. ASV81]MDQ4213498.1 phosphoglycerate dehydrogenase [Microbacterium sp. ASV81]